MNTSRHCLIVRAGRGTRGTRGLNWASADRGCRVPLRGSPKTPPPPRQPRPEPLPFVSIRRRRLTDVLDRVWVLLRHDNRSTGRQRGPDRRHRKRYMYTPFSGQFRRQCMHLENSAGNIGGSAVQRPVGHDSAAEMSKLVALLPNDMQIVQNWSRKGVVLTY